MAESPNTRERLWVSPPTREVTAATMPLPDLAAALRRAGYKVFDIQDKYPGIEHPALIVEPSDG